MDEIWKDFDYAEEEDFDKIIDTKFPKDKLIVLGKKIATLPDGKQIFRKVLKLFKDRLKMIENDKLIGEWQKC